MKKIFLSFALLLCVGSAFGQTADKLIAKCKAMGNGTTYTDITSQFKSITDWDSKEKEKAARHIDKIEVIMGLFENEQQEKELKTELEELDGFEVLADMRNNPGEAAEEALRGLADMMTMKARIFVKQEDVRIREMIQYTRIAEMFFLVRISGQLTMEEMELLMAEDSSHKTIELNLTPDMSDAGEATELNSDPIVAVLIDDVFYPEMTDHKMAMDYLFEQGYLLDNVKSNFSRATKEDKRKYGKNKDLVLKIDTSEAKRQYGK